MQMGDKIVVMNRGRVEQFGTPHEIFDKPASLFVADFIGSPPMNFLDFDGRVEAGAQSVSLKGREIAVPRQQQSASGRLVLGVRPEHIAVGDDGPIRGEVLATEYLGTTQIVTLATDGGALKARINSSQPARVGEKVGLSFAAPKLTLFDRNTGRALRSDLNAEVFANG
jgi:multiple sugar transport system ATP-binding protein